MNWLDTVADVHWVLSDFDQVRPDSSPVRAQIAPTDSTIGGALDGDAISSTRAPFGLALSVQRAPLANLRGVALNSVGQLSVGEGSLSGHVLVQGRHAPL